ncbi:MAG: ribosome biogenesis GTPase Der, partial [Alphaproteobacteria bacterium]
HIPPLSKNGRRIRLKYITQTAVRPQTFTVFGNIIEEIPESYSRYLYNDLRATFNLGGVPIRMKFKKIDNPYENRKSKKH